MSKPITVEVEYVQDHSYIDNFEIYRWYQAAIPIFEILVGFRVMAERLNPMSEFSVFVVFLSLLPHRQKF